MEKKNFVTNSFLPYKSPPVSSGAYTDEDVMTIMLNTDDLPIVLWNKNVDHYGREIKYVTVFVPVRRFDDYIDTYLYTYALTRVMWR